MIKNYFKIAFRGFWRHKLLTLINIVGLSIGISTALVIYLIVHFDFTFDKFHPDNDKIYRVVTDFTFAGELSYNGGVTGQLPDAVKNEVTGLKGSAPFYMAGEYNVSVDNGAKAATKFKSQQGIAYSDERYFNMFPYKWLIGSPETALNGPHQVVLASEQAKKYFPNLSFSQMLGRQVMYDSIKTVVTGVVEEFKENTDFNYHDFISYSTIQSVNDIKIQLAEWGSTNGASQFFVKLNDGTSAQNIERQLKGLQKKYFPPKPENRGTLAVLRLQPLADIHFNERYAVYDNPTVSRATLYGLMTIAAFLLILGCINFINLTTAQGAQRAKEIGIRKTMGSNRGQLVSQFLSETFLVTLFAVVISVCMAPVILKIFADFIPAGVKADIFHQPDMIIFLLILTVTVSLLSGFYPAVVLSGYKPVSVLKNQSIGRKNKTRNSLLRKSLTVTQFVIAQFFIMATILVSKQIYYAINTDLGFKKDAILYIHPPYMPKYADRKQVFINKIKAIPQVELVSLGGDIPSSSGWSSRDITYKDGKKEIKAEVFLKRGDENYLKLYHIKMLAGRNIVPDDITSGIIINNNYARALGFKDVQKAVGISIPFKQDKMMQVVGVMSDFHQASLHTPIKPMIFYIQGQNNLGTVHIALKPQTADGNEWKTAIAAMQKIWKEIYPEEEFNYHFFDESIAKFYDSERRTSTLLNWATGLSIFISCLGLLGLAIYTTSLRTKEIGVRKVLGASVAQIVALLSTELIWLIVLAFILVTPLAWYAMNKWMESFSDRTNISWWIFAGSAFAMLLAAVLTSSFQTIKAAIANPVKSLRSE